MVKRSWKIRGLRNSLQQQFGVLICQTILDNPLVGTVKIVIMLQKNNL